MKNDVTHRIIVRYRQEITPRHRLVMGARTFAIVSATNPGEVGMDHVCMCKEIV
jgi:head-tail adaptor